MEIRIIQKEGGLWDVHSGDKWADRLGYDEMLGLVAALTMPESRPCLRWMKTKEEHEFQENYFNSLGKQNK